jgi:Bacterial Ig-like domain
VKLLVAAGAAVAVLAFAAPAFAFELDRAATTPTPGIKNPTGNLVTAVFTEAVDPATTFAGFMKVAEVLPLNQKRPLPGGPLTATPVPGSNNTQWQLRLPSDLGSNASYEVTVDPSIRSVSGLPLAAGSSFWDFDTSADGRPPKPVTTFSAALSGSTVQLSWTVPALDFDRAGVRVLRREGGQQPSLGDPQSQTVGTFADGTTSFTDTTVVAGSSYSYAAFAVDRDAPANASPFLFAGPVTLPAPPPPPPRIPPSVKSKLLLPKRPDQVLAKRKLPLRWQQDKRARYYNLQLFRGTQKILSIHPSRTAATVDAKLLRSGSYTLVIWSGVGAPVRNRYVKTPWLTVPLRVVAGR